MDFGRTSRALFFLVKLWRHMLRACAHVYMYSITPTFTKRTSLRLTISPAIFFILMPVYTHELYDILSLKDDYCVFTRSYFCTFKASQKLNILCYAESVPQF